MIVLLFQHFAESEVEELNRTRFVEKDVARLDVAVNNAPRMSVTGGPRDRGAPVGAAPPGDDRLCQP